MSGPWETLGIEATGDVKAIRRAYTRLLKAMDPETDPAGFATLRYAHDWAMHLAEQGEAGIPEPSSEGVAEQASTDAAAVETASELHFDADFEALRALHAAILDPVSTATPAQIADLSNRVLADPAMLNLEHAESVERFFAENIVQGTPRSDPMIDPAIAHFRWNSSDTELQRPPIIAWILQRANDRYFEIGLPTESYSFARILARLRRSPSTDGHVWLVWWLGPRVEYLIAYLQTYHSTILAGLDQETFEWWGDRINRLRKAVFPIGPLYEFRRKTILSKPLKQAGLHPVIGSAPFLLLLLIGGVMFAAVSDGARSRRELAPTAPSSSADMSLPTSPPPPQIAVLSDIDGDIDRVLRLFTQGELTSSSVRAANPALHARLEQAWHAASSQRDGGGGIDAFQNFASAAGTALNSVLERALRGPNDQLVLDHAAYYESRLRWAERASPEDCADFLSGKPVEAALPSLDAARRRLVARAVLGGTPPADAAQERPRFTVPADFVDDATRRAGLSRAAFAQAIESKGPAIAQCNAMIALLDSAMLRRDKASLQLLRSMFGS